MTSTAALKDTGVALYRCSRCHTSFRLDNTGIRNCPNCNRSMVNYEPIRARYSSTKCAKKCLAATSNICECECEGQNHGGGN